MQVVSQKEFEIVINNSDLDEDTKKELLENSKPFYELSEFIQKKFNMSAAGAELMLAIYLQITVEKMGDTAFDMSEQELASTLLTGYAKKHGFEKHDDLGHSWMTLMKLTGKK